MAAGHVQWGDAAHASGSKSCPAAGRTARQAAWIAPRELVGVRWLGPSWRPPRIKTIRACRKSAFGRPVPLNEELFYSAADGRCQSSGIGDFDAIEDDGDVR